MTTDTMAADLAEATKRLLERIDDLCGSDDAEFPDQDTQAMRYLRESRSYQEAKRLVMRMEWAR